MRIVPSFVAVAVAGLVVLGTAAPAEAAVGPRPLQALAVAQSRQLLFHLTTPFAQVSSPVSCRQAGTARGVLLLPALAGLAGNRTFTCVTRDHAALVDLSGYVCSEDNDPTDTYTTADGRVLRFSRGNLEAICQDVIRYVTPAPLTVDGRTLPPDTVAVSTHAFLSVVHPSTASHPSQGTYWDATVALGHPGLLWAAYGGYKELVPLGVGRHTIVTDLSAIVGAPAVLTFDITVCR